MSEKVNLVISWLLVKLVRVYQLTISPWLGPSCRHHPTCSSYMIESVQEWGALKGFWMGIKRLSGCHPWGSEGYDPVPKKDQPKKSKP